MHSSHLTRHAAPYRHSAPLLPRHPLRLARNHRSRLAPRATAKTSSASSNIVVSVKLPNGLELRHFTTEELNFLYREVYEDRVYLRRGVSLQAGDTVIDIGANTGLFSLLASERVGPTGRVVSLEPMPRTFQLLGENVRAHAAWCQTRGVAACAPVLLNCGAGPEGRETATFTSYSDSASGWSTMYPDDEEVRHNMRTYILNMLSGQHQEQRQAGGGGGGGAGDGSSASEGGSGAASAAPSPSPDLEAAVPEPWLARAGRALWRLPPLRPLLRAAAGLYVERMLAGQRSWSCPLVPLSRIIREQGLERVDLIKIDVERAELDVLAGLGPADWTLVRQLVVEVHDVAGRLDEVRTLLADRGFRSVVSEQGAELAGSTLHVVYAVR